MKISDIIYETDNPTSQRTKTMYRVIYNGREIGWYNTMPDAAKAAQRLEQQHGGRALVHPTVYQPKEIKEDTSCPTVTGGTICD